MFCLGFDDYNSIESCAKVHGGGDSAPSGSTRRMPRTTLETI